MLEESRDRIPIALELLIGEDCMDLRVAWTADPDGLLHGFPVEFALIAFVCVSRPGNEVMSRQRFFPTADRTIRHARSPAGNQMIAVR